MLSQINRRTFFRKTLAASTGGALALGAGRAHGAPASTRAASPHAGGLPKGTIGDLKVSRLLLGGNLLTHFTHSRDLKYVYNLAAQYNTEEKILQTLSLAEAHGIDTLVIHTVPRTMQILKKHRYERNGTIKWIVCPTAPIEPDLKEYAKHVEQTVEDGADAIYLWGVRGDALVTAQQVDLIAGAVEAAKKLGVPSGVGAHDLRVIQACEEKKVDADFYIKTLHHHQYPTGPRADELGKPTAEIPGYWCLNPQEVVDFMQGVEKPWIAFKVMAAGAIPPANAFAYAFTSGADHVLAGMFDFEIEQDANIAKNVLAQTRRKRPWRS